MNVTGGELVIHAEGSAIDSDGTINLISGTAVIESEETCIDFDQGLYRSPDYIVDCKCENTEAKVPAGTSGCEGEPVCE